MIVEIDGQQYDVPDDATPAHIQKALGLKAPSSMKDNEPNSYRENIQKSIQDVTKGAGIGLFQGLSDVGANVAQFPGDIYSYLSGKESYKAPRPDFRGYIPQSESGHTAESIGEFSAPFALPGVGASASGAKLLPKLLAGAGLGAASSENRSLGALLGAAFGAAPLAKELPITKKMAGRPLMEAQNLIKERGIDKLSVPSDIFKDAKEFLPKTTPYKKLLEKAKTGDYDSLFTLQSDLRKIGSQLKRSISGAERIHGGEALKLRQKLQDSMKSHLRKEGHEDIAGLITKGQNKYRQHMKYRPYAAGIATTIAAKDPLINKLRKIILD